MINRDTLIEELVASCPSAVGYLMKRGIRCLTCGEPIWGTLESVAKERGFTDTQIDEIVVALRRLESEQQGS